MKKVEVASKRTAAASEDSEKHLHTSFCESLRRNSMGFRGDFAKEDAKSDQCECKPPQLTEMDGNTTVKKRVT